GSAIRAYVGGWLNISGAGGNDDGTNILVPTADNGNGFWIGYGNSNSPIKMGSVGDELEVAAGPYAEVSVGYGLKANASTYSAVSPSTCAAWDSNRMLISGTLQPTPTPPTYGNLTGSAPITFSATRQVVGGAANI